MKTFTSVLMLPIVQQNLQRLQTKKTELEWVLSKNRKEYADVEAEIEQNKQLIRELFAEVEEAREQESQAKQKLQRVREIYQREKQRLMKLRNRIIYVARDSEANEPADSRTGLEGLDHSLHHQDLADTIASEQEHLEVANRRIMEAEAKIENIKLELTAKKELAMFLAQQNEERKLQNEACRRMMEEELLSRIEKGLAIHYSQVFSSLNDRWSLPCCFVSNLLTFLPADYLHDFSIRHGKMLSSEEDYARHLCIECMVLAHSDSISWMKLCASLPDNDLSSLHRLPIAFL
jgi:predicted  nucleic acid-binding Zn-ribbon protein